MKKYKGVVFFDVDGTLIDCFKNIHEPTEKTKYAIKKLKESGYLVLIATGRPMTFIKEELLKLDASGYIASNGSYCEIEKEVVFNYSIEQARLLEIMQYLEEHNIEYIMEGQAVNYVKDLKNVEINKFIEKLTIKNDTFIDEWDKNKIICNKIIVCTSKPNIFLETKDKFKNEYAYIYYENQCFFEMFNPKYTKGFGVRKLIDILGIDNDNTYAFGDGENDIEMFKEVKHGIAMGGYHKNLKEYAYDFTEDVANEGIYKGLIKLKLI